VEPEPPILAYAEPTRDAQRSWYGFASVAVALSAGVGGAWLARIDWYSIGDGDYAWWRRIILAASALASLLGLAGVKGTGGRHAISAIGLGMGLIDVVVLAVLLAIRGP
jgi:hypothetical protein